MCEIGGCLEEGREDGGVRNVLKVSELNHGVKERAYQEDCVENMKCGEVGRSRVWRRSGKSSEI